MRRPNGREMSHGCYWRTEGSIPWIQLQGGSGWHHSRGIPGSLRPGFRPGSSGVSGDLAQEGRDERRRIVGLAEDEHRRHDRAQERLYRSIRRDRQGDTRPKCWQIRSVHSERAGAGAWASSSAGAWAFARTGRAPRWAPRGGPHVIVNRRDAVVLIISPPLTERSCRTRARRPCGRSGSRRASNVSSAPAAAARYSSSSSAISSALPTSPGDDSTCPLWVYPDLPPVTGLVCLFR
jgi:hypothetical protein